MADPIKPEASPLSQPVAASSSILALATNKPIVPVPPPVPAVPEELREFGDYTATRKAIYDQVMAAATSIEPIANQRYTLSVSDVAYEGPEAYRIADVKRANLEGRSLTRRLRGTWNLVDNATGTPIAQKRTTLANVPHYTEEGTFMLNGNPWSLASQMRLRPGIYGRIKASGEVESHVNVMPGKGISHRYVLEPSTGVFKIHVNQAEVPLIPLLRSMGATDEELSQAWGKDLLAYNRKHDNPATLNRLYQKLVSTPVEGATDPDKAKAIVDRLQKMEFDPEVNRRTLGGDYKNLSKDAILAATKKMLAISRGEAEVDDRDHPVNQYVYGPEDLLAERIKRAKQLLQKQMWRVTTKGDIDAIPASLFDGALHGAITESGVGTLPEGVNLAEYLDLNTRVTRMGVGGLSSTESIPDESRSVSPGHLNLIDLLRTPEGLTVGVDLRFANTARKSVGSPTVKSEYIDPKTGAKAFLTPQEVHGKVIAFPNELRKPGDLVWAMVNGMPRMVPRTRVDFEIPHMETSFSPINNLVPMKSGIKGQRASMASRFFTQSLPLVNREAPLVQSAVPGTLGKTSYDEHYGTKLGAIRASRAGRVVEVDADGVKVKYEDGTTQTHDLYNYHPNARKTYNLSFAKVKPGDRVEPGQLLAVSNFTDQDGAVALGLNARTLAHAGHGYAYEDGYVISESMARRMTSQHMYRHQLDLTENHRTDKKHFASIFPAKYDKTKLQAIDDQGVVVPGTVVRAGDPLILAAVQRPASAKTIHAARKGTFTDQTLTWEHHDTGIVTDVAKTDKGYVVTVRTESPAKQGDKMCYDQDTEILTSTGWKSVADVTTKDEVCVLDAVTGIFYYEHPAACHAYPSGDEMYRISSRYVDLFVTAKHKMLVRHRTTKGAFNLECAKDLFGKEVYYKKNGRWLAEEHDKMQRFAGQLFPLRVLAVAMGAYLAGGSWQEDLTNVTAQQLAAMPELLREFCGDRPSEYRIPPFVFTWSRQLQALLLGQMISTNLKRHAAGATNRITVKSKQLADELQRLCLHAGSSADISRKQALLSDANPDDAVDTRYVVHIVSQAVEPQVGGIGAATKEELIQDYQGPVYCVTTSTGVVYVRRNGKAVWSGNSNRFANKGVITRVVPDSEMPHDKEGRPYEVLFNPLGVISRMNPAVVVEAILGKIARKTGKTYKIEDFADIKDLAQFAVDEAKKHGINPFEDFHDPVLGRDVKGAMSGDMYFLKLSHTAESKDQARGIGSYSSMGQPSKVGGAVGSCFVGDQLLMTKSGVVTISSICDHKLPVNVLSYNARTRKPEYRKVTDWFCRIVDVSEIIEVITENYHTICATPNHLVYTADRTKKVPLSTFKVGDSFCVYDVRTETLVERKITDIMPYRAEKRVQRVPVYDITVEGNHNYFASGVLVSNSKRFAMQDVYALAGHGAYDVLRDVKLVRGQRNPQYWSAMMAGVVPPTPEVPQVYQHMVNSLKAAGINVVRQGTQTKLMALTDKDIDAYAGDRELQNAETVDWKDAMKPVRGGLFDDTLFGGHGQTQRWAKISFPEPMLNPAFEDPARNLLGLTKEKLRQVLAGRDELHGKKGPAAIQSALAAIDVDRQLQTIRGQLPNLKGQNRDIAVRKLGYLKALADNKMTPADYMITKMPVIPPAFRPVSVLETTGSTLVADANLLYKEVLDAKNNLKALHGRVDDLGDERLALYDAMKAVSGLGEPTNPKNQDKGLKGFLTNVLGDNPKFSSFQQSLLGTNMDLVGRAVIVPDPELSIDEVGLPEARAWDVYSPLVVRRLVQRGVQRLRAMEEVEKRSELAKTALIEEMKHRPVQLNRAPVLHRFGHMAFFPRLTDGDTVRISPMIVTALNADFDGNCVCFWEKVILTLTDAICDTEAGLNFCSQLEATVMRLTGKTFVAWWEEGGRSVCLPIGEFPRLGACVVSKTGQEVYTVPHGVCVSSYDPPTGQHVLADITHFTVDRDHPCVRVTTTRKRTVDVSDNESLCVFDPTSGQLVKKRPAEAIGLFVPYIRKDFITGTKYNREIGWWYGALVADGWVSTRVVGYSKSDDRKRAEFLRIAQQYFPGSFSVREYHEAKTAAKFSSSSKLHLNGSINQKVLSVYSEDIGDAANDGKRAALFKKLPDDLLHNGSREALLGLLAGLLDGDASLTWNSSMKKKRLACRFCTSSPALAASIQLLLRKLGVRSSITTTPARNRSQESYTLCPSTIDLYRVFPDVQLIGEEARQVVAEFLAGEAPGRVTGETTDNIPITASLAGFLATKLSKMGDTNAYSVFRKALTTGYVSRFSALHAVESYAAYADADDHPHLQSFTNIASNRDVDWEAVTTVEDIGCHDVFDFDVPATKVYTIANGLVIYDTSNYTVPVTEEARRQAIDRMLPSRNLFAASDRNTANFQPLREHRAGLFEATSYKNQKPSRVFATGSDLYKAYMSGEMDPGDPVTILNEDK